MIGILHGYLLDGSGSNLWTQSMVRTLCRRGETVHLMCQEPAPERFDFVARAISYDSELRPTVVFDGETVYPGRCIVHKPDIGAVLPVFVWDSYDEFDQVVPMIELDDGVIDEYLDRNTRLLRFLVEEHGLTVLHANHTVLMPVVARRILKEFGVPYTIMPHGSAIEYAVKRDPRFYRMALDAVRDAGRVFVVGPEMRRRVLTVFSELPELEDKLVDLNLGVDSGLFEPLEPAGREKNIEALRESLEGVERGKGPDLSLTMRQRLGNDLDRVKLREVLAQASDYNAKLTDADCESKLERVDWENDRVLLFVGRLIASKGVHAVLAALPSILKREPRARLIIVGHGPLREPLEAMLWALDIGRHELLNNILQWGSFLEGAPEVEPLDHMVRYLALLKERGELDQYLQLASDVHLSDRVIFTGYLTHRELRYLFPCCDVAVFPSIVAEAGPLVFLEALASGVFPLGIYSAGMRASIDSVAERLPGEAAELMKLSTDPVRTVDDIVNGVVGALDLGRRHVNDLRRLAVDHYDWDAVGGRFLSTLKLWL